MFTDQRHPKRKQILQKDVGMWKEDFRSERLPLWILLSRDRYSGCVQGLPRIGGCVSSRGAATWLHKLVTWRRFYSWRTTAGSQLSVISCDNSVLWEYSVKARPLRKAMDQSAFSRYILFDPKTLLPEMWPGDLLLYSVCTRISHRIQVCDNRSLETISIYLELFKFKKWYFWKLFILHLSITD